MAGRGPRWLAGSELRDWIGLRRVGEGGVAMFGTHYFDHGCRVPCFLPETFRRLAAEKLTALLEPDYPGGLRRVVITSRGHARYQNLTARRGPATGANQPPGDGWAGR